MEISSVMTKKPAILEENATVLDAIEKMQEVGCGILPIGDKKHIKGVITDRDIITRAIPKNEDLSKMLVANIMTKNVIFCEEDDSLKKAVQEMNKHNMRRVLIKDKHHVLTGILSLGDLIRRVENKSLLANLLRETTVA